MAFLKREYTILAGFIVIVFVLLFAFVGAHTAYAFLAGAVCSILAGYTGMKAACHANVRTAQAANQHGQGPALNIAFSGGAVMGLAVAGLGLFGVGALASAIGIWDDISQASTINGFAMGASSIALFARVGGGIFTKTADVGADLVGKVEAGFPRTIPAIRPLSPTMSATMSAMSLAWVPISLNRTLDRSLLPLPSPPPRPRHCWPLLLRVSPIRPKRNLRR